MGEWGAGGCVFHATRMKARPSPWGCREDGNSGGWEAVMGEKGSHPPPPPGRLWESEQRSGVQLKVDLPGFRRE